MSDCCTPTGDRQIFSEKNARAEARRYRRKGLDATSRRIGDLLKERGVEGKTLLEVGAASERSRSNCSRRVFPAVNVELAPTYEDAASDLLHEVGFADHVERRVMDFADAGTEVETADIVVMNRVICCYPDMPKLASAAAERTREVLVMSFPNRRWWTRLGLTLANFGFRVVGMEFRVFLHPPELIQAAVQQHRFRTMFNERGLLWQVNAFERIA
ncbi:MAG: methyltransferase domain-containing protein [Candidatus Dormibacteraceae bacterium]